jgi:hypothetical protein
VTEKQVGERWIPVAVAVLALSTLAMIARLAGCAPAKTTPPSPSSQRGEPAEAIRRIVARYREAEAYRDEGSLRLAYRRQGEAVSQSWPWSVQWERPGRLRIDAYNLHLSSDAGQQLIARIDDAESNDMDGQVVVRRAPETIKLSALEADPILFSQLVGRIQRLPIQLELLLGDAPLAAATEPGVELSWLDDAPIKGRTFSRIAAKSGDQRFVFWFDANTSTLRRLEYPAASLLPELAGDPAVSDAELIADLINAEFAAPTDPQAFTLALPADAKRVRAFVTPVVALDARALGQPVENFELPRLDGERVTPESLQGEPTALLWYAHHAACEEPLRTFVATCKGLRHLNAAVACTEPAEVGDKAVREQLKAWKVDATAARDLKEVHARKFQVRELPSITLLDAEGRLQWIGSGPTMLAEFPEAVRRVQNGEDLAAEALARTKRLQTAYEKLVAAGGPELDLGVLPASAPSILKLKNAWRLNEEFTSPGTLWVDPTDGSRLLAVGGESTVFEVTSEGTVAAKHELNLRRGDKISALRATLHKGRRVVALFSPLEPRVRVFDDEWKLLFSYPDADSTLAVRDVQWATLGHDEPTLLVAFADTAGLHAVSLSGQRLWTNRSYVPLLSIAPGFQLPCAFLTGRGGAMTIIDLGETAGEKEVRNWSLAHLFTARFSSPHQSAYLGVGAQDDGKPCLIGLNVAFEEQWNYPLPAGSFQRPVDFVASGVLRSGSSGEWVAAWSDGSIHLVSEDGNFSDTFNTGQELRGIAIVEGPMKPLLVVSTAKELLAWEVGE